MTVVRLPERGASGACRLTWPATRYRVFRRRRRPTWPGRTAAASTNEPANITGTAAIGNHNAGSRSALGGFRGPFASHNSRAFRNPQFEGLSPATNRPTDVPRASPLYSGGIEGGFLGRATATNDPSLGRQGSPNDPISRCARAQFSWLSRPPCRAGGSTLPVIPAGRVVAPIRPSHCRESCRESVFHAASDVVFPVTREPTDAVVFHSARPKRTTPTAKNKA